MVDFSERCPACGVKAGFSNIDTVGWYPHKRTCKYALPPPDPDPLDELADPPNDDDEDARPEVRT